MSEIRRVGVLGCGQMGSGIAQAAAVAGFEVSAGDLHDEHLTRGRVAIEQSLTRFVEKGKLAAEARQAALARLRFTTDLHELA